MGDSIPPRLDLHDFIVMDTYDNNYVISDELSAIIRRSYASKLFHPKVIKALGTTHVKGFIVHGQLVGSEKTIRYILERFVYQSHKLTYIDRFEDGLFDEALTEFEAKGLDSIPYIFVCNLNKYGPEVFNKFFERLNSLESKPDNIVFVGAITELSKLNRELFHHNVMCFDLTE